MAIHLKILNKENQEVLSENEFDNDIITIGRESSNLLHLDDAKKLIGRKHAEIQLDNGVYYLIDKKTKNGTFINETRLESEQPYTLEDGTRFRIGDYYIEFSHIRLPDGLDKLDSLDVTRYELNPFLEISHELKNAFDILNNHYQNESAEVRKETLIQALKEVFLGQDYKEINSIINGILGNQNDAETPAHPIKEEFDFKYSDNTHQTLELLLELMVKLIQVTWKFRTEFIGSTIVQTKESMQMRSLEKLKELLFNPEATKETLQKLNTQFKTEINEAILHQIALLDGYRSSVREGVPELLKHINPAIIKKELAQKKMKIGPLTIPYKIIPFYVELNTLKQIQKKHYELLEENTGLFEKKIFRPPFIRSYLDSLNKARKHNNPNEKN